VALLAAAKLTGRFSFSAKELIAQQPTDSQAEQCWEFIDRLRLSQGRSMKSFGRSFARAVAVAAAKEFTLSNAEIVESRNPFSLSIQENLSEDFLDEVDKQLPPQPWRLGVHRMVAEKLKCSPFRVSQAIEHLMLSGRRNRQKDGVVYDDEGKVLAFDPSRVDAGELPAEYSE
jgi:hypothetical protein